MAVLGIISGPCELDESRPVVQIVNRGPIVFRRAGRLAVDEQVHQLLRVHSHRWPDVEQNVAKW
jgi:hypothetical protein